MQLSYTDVVTKAALLLSGWWWFGFSTASLFIGCSENDGGTGDRRGEGQEENCEWIVVLPIPCLGW